MNIVVAVFALPGSGSVLLWLWIRVWYGCLVGTSRTEVCHADGRTVPGDPPQTLLGNLPAVYRASNRLAAYNGVHEGFGEIVQFFWLWRPQLSLRIWGNAAGQFVDVRERSSCSDRLAGHGSKAANVAQPQPQAAVLHRAVPLQTVSVAPKNAGAYPTLLKDEFKPLIEKGGVDLWLVYRHVFGSETNQITTIRSIRNYAGLDAGPLTARVLGPQAASILSVQTDLLLESSRIVIAQYDKELSYGRVF